MESTRKTLCSKLITVSGRYGRVEFWDDLKKLYQMCGVEEREVAFLLTDSQITNEVFLGDVSNILNSGEVPGPICLCLKHLSRLRSSAGPLPFTAL